MNSSLVDWSFKCGRLLGIDIRVHWSFLVYIAIELFQKPSADNALFLAVLFGTVLIHELGHCMGGRYFGLRTDQILLWPLGGLAYVGGQRTTWQDFWVTFWGPFVHIPIGLTAAALLAYQGATFSFQAALLNPIVVHADYSPLNQFLFVLLNVQVWLFALNVFLPAYPLDGGRMLVALLIKRLGIDKTSLVAMLLTALCACYLLVKGSSFIGFFLLMEAAQLYQRRQEGTVEDDPSFRYRSSGSGPKVKLAAGGHLRLVPPTGSASTATKNCPQCSRSLPITAKMCGFCEIML